MQKLEYIWLDGYWPEANLRSKVKIDPVTRRIPEDWSFDGSSTKQSEGNYSDCILHPVKTYKMIDRIRADATRLDQAENLGATYVMCEVLNPDESSHESNYRTVLEDILPKDDYNWWFGFEQEYFMYQNGHPLGWPDDPARFPPPQGQYYCGVGTENVVGREIVDRHAEACVHAGINITGTNAEVALGQWEYQVLGKGIEAGDDLWMSRYILIKIAEKHGVQINFHPKPLGDTNWNGSGMHTNFSNKMMRTGGSIDMMNAMCQRLGTKHKDAIKVYGSNNDKRLTGDHETASIAEFSFGVSDRGASIRIPIYTVNNDWNGYLEDRRPASNADPYKVINHIVRTLK